MRPDFSLIWGADNAPFTPIEASDYTAGWVFRTGAPPRRVNFDYFQNLSDQRTSWLGEQMLLTVGHEWQSDVTYDAYAIVRSPVNDQLYRSLVGSNIGNEPSASAAQWEKDYSNTPAKITKITSSGTYTPTPGMKAAFVQVQAGGGGGGGAQGAGTGASAGAGGSAGGYSEGYFLAATIGASQTVTVGAAGTGGVAVNSGTAGGTSSFGALLTATGGSFGLASNSTAANTRGAVPGGAGGGTGSTQNGQNGSIGVIFGPVQVSVAGSGGASRLGSGGAGRNEDSDGFAGNGYGAGGAGGAASTVTRNGGSGSPGIVIVTEYF